MGSPMQSSPNTVPNLDAMSNDELGKFWSKYSRCTRKDAAALIGDRRTGYVKLASALANYAINKATAQTCRARGDIQAAQVYETTCDRIHDELPHDLRW